MKKIFLAFLGLILLVVTLHISTPFYGGMPGIISRIQARVVNKTAEVVHDPGACALIRGYWSRGLYARLRDKCVTKYIQNVVDEVSDCEKTQLITDMSTLSQIWLRDEYRYTCLIHHYQAMLGNSLTQQWLPDRCINARDKLVIFEHYLEDIRVDRANKDTLSHGWSPLTESDIDEIEQCEWFLDTKKVYSFLRDSGVSEAEKNYIESEKKKTFELK
jgi:hypothetical protein